MSDADSPDNDGPEMVQIPLQLSRTFLAEIDSTWQEQGFNSRSEFLRYAAREAVKHPEFTREGWKQVAAREHDFDAGTPDSGSRDPVIEMMHRQEYTE